MADFPTFTQIHPRTDDVYQDDRREVVTEGGKVFVRSFFHEDVRTFLVENDISAEDLSTLMAHYRAHALLSFNFLYDEDAATYLVRYVGIPVYRPSGSCDSIVVVSRLEEVDL